MSFPLKIGQASLRSRYLQAPIPTCLARNILPVSHALRYSTKPPKPPRPPQPPRPPPPQLERPPTPRARRRAPSWMITYNQRFREALLERTERTEGRVRSVSKELEGAKRRGDSALKRRCEHKMQRLWLELEKDARFVRVFTGSLSAFVKESEDLDRKDIDLIRNISSEILAMWGDNFKRLFHTTFAGAGLVSIGARLYELGSFVWNLICDIAILPMALPLNLYFKAKVRKMDAKQ